MKYSLKQIAPPAIEPVTVAQVKLSAHIDGDTEDSLTAAWITAARKMLEEYDRRAYITQVWELALDGFPPVPFNLPRAPLQSLMSIKFTDKSGATYTLYDSGLDPSNTTTTASPNSGNSDFIIGNIMCSDPGRITLADGVTWPGDDLQSIDAVKIRYAAGYGDAAADVVKHRPQVVPAIMLYCTWANENRAGELPMPPHILDLMRPERGTQIIWDDPTEQEK